MAERKKKPPYENLPAAPAPDGYLKPAKSGRTFSLSIDKLARFLLLQAGEETERFNSRRLGPN